MTESVPYSLAGKRVWIAGHRGMVGAALTRRLAREDCQILTVDRGNLDLRGNRRDPAVPDEHGTLVGLGSGALHNPGVDQRMQTG